MVAALELTAGTRSACGILLLTIVAVEFGGLTMLRIVRGQQPATAFQKSFARAGHAHAGVFVVFALVAQILADAAALDGADDFVGRSGIWLAAILFPAGFFLSSAGPGRTEANRLIALLYAGVLCLTAGVVTLGIALITS
jgi:drug/metabolite transporter superfamily protein YnfA